MSDIKEFKQIGKAEWKKSMKIAKRYGKV